MNSREANRPFGYPPKFETGQHAFSCLRCCCVRCHPCTDQQGDGGSYDPERLEAQDDHGEYGSGEETDQSHDLIGDPQGQIAEHAWEET